MSLPSHGRRGWTEPPGTLGAARYKKPSAAAPCSPPIRRRHAHLLPLPPFLPACGAGHLCSKHRRREHLPPGCAAAATPPRLAMLASAPFVGLHCAALPLLPHSRALLYTRTAEPRHATMATARAASSISTSTKPPEPLLCSTMPSSPSCSAQNLAVPEQRSHTLLPASSSAGAASSPHHDVVALAPKTGASLTPSLDPDITSASSSPSNRAPAPSSPSSTTVTPRSLPHPRQAPRRRLPLLRL